MVFFIANAGWVEGGVVAEPDGSVKNILRTGWLGKDKAAIVDVSANGTTLSFNPQNVINFPGGCVKFVIRHDPQTNLYWALVNKQTDPTAERNRLVLTSSPDLINWTTKATILEDSRSSVVGFQYADWQIEGQDIIFVLRTAFGGSVPYSSAPFHDAEFVTFHRIPNFRMLDIAATTILTSSEDAPVDQHQNWASATKGIPHSNWNWTANELRPMLYGDDHYVAGLRQDVLIKWDFSTMPATDIITNVTMEMSGWDNPDGVIDVYGIQEGSWTEDTVTWNSWATTPQTLVLLGQLTEAGPAAVAGETIFANANLTQWVKNWINGNQANNGIILKMSGPNPATGTIGDSFSAKEEASGTAYGHAPQLVIQHVPASAFSTVTGTVQLEGYTGNLQSIGVQVEFRQNGAVVRTEKTLLDSAGAFSINAVQKGYYDVAVKSFTYLQTVIPNVNVNSDPTSLNPVVLKAGDLNGDSEINLLDFGIIANSWMSAE
ncbi:MAG: DNRLRE domain-containing protein [Phycisphaerales bacterium]